MANIVFLEVDREDEERIRKHFPKATIVGGVLKGKALIDACANAEAVCCFINSQFSKDIIAKLPKLKLICTRSVGFDHIDVAACDAKDIVVCNVPDYGSHVIAEHVFALLLSALRHIPEGSKRVEEGTFDYHGLRGMALRGKTIGIVGTGKIGRRVAEIAHGFGMDILAVDQCRTLELEKMGVRYVPLNDALRNSDILTLHVPDTPKTKHMINATTLKTMRNGVVLVNTARGALIDSGALLKALQSGIVSHALLDVLEHEQNFEENKRLVSHPNVVATPHIAFYADDSMRNMYTNAFESIDQWMAGKRPDHAVAPLNVVCDMPAIKRK